MLTTINWGRLVAQNRAKAPGIMWTPEEMKALQDGVSPELVRAGILSEKQLEETDKEEMGDGLELMTRDSLITKANELGIEFDKGYVNRGDLILEIRKKTKTK